MRFIMIHGGNMTKQNPKITAFAEGYDDAYTLGEYMNTYDEQDNPQEWNAYEQGYNEGLNKLMAEAQDGSSDHSVL